MSSFALAEKDVNKPITAAAQQDAVNAKASSKPEIKSMDYHRQVLASKMEGDRSKQYISPSDDIMSPCTAKLNAFRNKQVGKVKPKSLFAQASVKKLEGEGGLFGAAKGQSNIPK